MRARFTLLAACLATSAFAQTTDAVFTIQPWNLESRAPRVTGLGGIFVTTAEGSAALPLSPAAAFSSRKDAAAAFREGGAAGFVRFQGYVGSIDWAWGARVVRSLSTAFDGDAALLTSAGTIDSGRVTFDSHEITLGVATSSRVGPVGLRTGVSVPMGILRAQGTYASVDVADRSDTRITYSGDSLRVTVVASAVVELGHDFTPFALRVGAAHRNTLEEWRVERRALVLKDEVPTSADPSAPSFVLRTPDAWSLGADLRAPAGFRFAAQVDLVDYADVERAFPLVGGARSFGFAPAPRADHSWAIEHTLERSVRVRTRYGLRRAAAHRLVPAPTTATPVSRESDMFAGVGLGFSKLGMFVQLDVDASIEHGGVRNLTIGTRLLF